MNTIFKHPKIIIFVISIITLFFSWQLLSINLDNDVLSFIPDDNPEVLKYYDTEEQFGTDRIFAIAIESTSGTIFSSYFIDLIVKLTEDFESIDYDISVSSFANTNYIAGTSNELEVKPMLNDYTGSPEDIFKLKERLLSWDIYEGSLYSKDFSSTQILVQLNTAPTEKERNSIYEHIRSSLTKINHPSINWYITGLPAVTYLISNNMADDLVNLIPLVLLVVVLILYLSFRRMGGVILPLLTIVISIVWTMGFMSILGIALSMLDTIIPVLLVAVGSAYGIHIISHYYDEIRIKNFILTEEEHRRLVFSTVKRIGKPVFLAGLTTIIGFGSLISSSVIPIRTFGTFTAIGVAIALTVSITLIPAILILRHKSLKTAGTGGIFNSTVIFNYLYNFFHSHNTRVLILFIVITIAGIYGTTKINRDNILIEYFKKDTEIRVADNFLNSKFNGTTFFEIIVSGENPGDLTDPDILLAIDDMSSFLKSTYPEIKKVISFTDFVKKLNQIMNTAGKIENVEITEPNEVSGFTSFFEETEPDQTDHNSSVLVEPNTSLENKNMLDSKTQITYENIIHILNRAYLESDNVEMSADELIKQLNIELNYQGAAYYEIPSNPEKYPLRTKEEFKNLISQYLLLFSGNLNSLIDDEIEPMKTRIIVQLNDPGTLKANNAAISAAEYARDNFPAGYTIETTGTSKIMYVLTNLITRSQTMSILISLVLVFVILCLTHRSFAAGLIGILPIGFTVLINFGVMGIFGIILDISTAMVAAVSIGIGIDYTIHYLSYYHYERLKTSNLETVARKTLSGAGKAIIVNAISVACGFLVLLFSKFTPLNYFGLLIAITMITSSTASLTLLPILLEIFKPKFISRKK
ncbi:MAG: MMPL family transporter [Spirochaetia bacterium]|nr:MMPL family transporter [Spirochaetia bacterium]